MAQDAYGRGLGRAVGGGVQLGSSFRLGALRSSRLRPVWQPVESGSIAGHRGTR